MDNAKAFKRVVPRPLWPYLGALRRFVRATPRHTALQKKQLLSDPALTAPERELLSQVSSRIYPGDGMYNGDGAHYFKVGLSAIRCIDEALAQANLNKLQTILDLPCGQWAGDEISAAALSRGGDYGLRLQSGPLQFCVRTFGAVPAFSSLNLDEVALVKSFDLIWSGSLATHLNERGITSLLKLFHRQLAPGGLLLFTTHGDFVARRMPTRDFDYGLTEEQINRIGVDYPKPAYAFEDYPGEKDYGVSLTSPQWIRARVQELGGLREVYFKERGWDNHQDVLVSCVRGSRQDAKNAKI